MEKPKTSKPGTPPLHDNTRSENLIHYGRIGVENHGQEKDGDSTVAVLVCHGMGQQVRYETISSVARTILAEAQNQGANVSPVEVNFSQANEGFLGRAEIKWTDRDLKEHRVHVYEAYWAPLTEGKVNYWDTVKFLLRAAWNGLRYSKPFLPGKFERWMFGGRKTLTIGRFTFFGILFVLLFLALQVGIIGYVSFELAGHYKEVFSQPLPTITINGFLRTWFKWISPLIPGITTLIHPGFAQRAWWWALLRLGIWILLIAEALAARYFIIEYVGDVAAYVSPYKDSKFEEVRNQIQKIGLGVGKVIYGFEPSGENAPRYSKLIVVGHSLGSLLAYDTLNALIRLDNVSAQADTRQVVHRTRALITLGSPLDKTAFIFRMQAKDEQDWIREQLAAAAQPLIVSYNLYRPNPFEWVNIWSPMDIISGALNYYDDPIIPSDHSGIVQNMVDPEARAPLLAHNDYWNNKLLRQQLYRVIV